MEGRVVVWEQPYFLQFQRARKRHPSPVIHGRAVLCGNTLLFVIPGKRTKVSAPGNDDGCAGIKKSAF